MATLAGLRMSNITSEYERLAELELEAGAIAVTDKARTAHLNLAATYAHMCELRRQVVDASPIKDEIIAFLKAILPIIDELGMSTAAIHINDAIIELDGIGVPPPDSL